jgi:hypothetical protein
MEHLLNYRSFLDRPVDGAHRDIGGLTWGESRTHPAGNCARPVSIEIEWDSKNTGLQVRRGASREKTSKVLEGGRTFDLDKPDNGLPAAMRGHLRIRYSGLREFHSARFTPLPGRGLDQRAYRFLRGPEEYQCLPNWDESGGECYPGLSWNPPSHKSRRRTSVKGLDAELHGRTGCQARYSSTGDDSP